MHLISSLIWMQTTWQASLDFPCVCFIFFRWWRKNKEDRHAPRSVCVCTVLLSACFLWLNHYLPHFASPHQGGAWIRFLVLIYICALTVRICISYLLFISPAWALEEKFSLNQDVHVNARSWSFQLEGSHPDRHPGPRDQDKMFVLLHFKIILLSISSCHPPPNN
jgi:hypothetical protein